MIEIDRKRLITTILTWPKITVMVFQPVVPNVKHNITYCISSS